jgi:hypothetical protein
VELIRSQKATRGRVRPPKAVAKLQLTSLDKFRTGVLLECDASSHRFYHFDVICRVDADWLNYRGERQKKLVRTSLWDIACTVRDCQRGLDAG